MNERPRKATRLTVSLEEQDYRTLNEIALARDASVSWVIRQAIRQFIDASPKPIDQPALPAGSQRTSSRSRSAACAVFLKSSRAGQASTESRRAVP